MKKSLTLLAATVLLSTFFLTGCAGTNGVGNKHEEAHVEPYDVHKTNPEDLDWIPILPTEPIKQEQSRPNRTH